jgi:surface protein
VPVQNGEGFVGEWDKEHYSRKRELSFKFERSSFIAQGPSIASVKQTQYCRVEGNSKCVFASLISGDSSIHHCHSEALLCLLPCSRPSFSSTISKWDVSSVTSMNYMFKGAAAFNDDIS